jgi:superfamily II DNA or RNA helicase
VGDLASLLAGLSADERAQGRGFERLCKWLLENAPEYRSQLQRVWLWDEWPGRWAADAGIDLVAEAEDGLWAVQAKHYDPAYSIRKTDIDSFLSESSRPGFSYRLLIASTDHVGRSARRTLAGQEKPVGMLLRSQLEVLEVEWPTSLRRLGPAKPKRKKPRPHQRKAIRDCVSGLALTDRGQLVMACGTGKTLIGPFLAETLDARRVLVLVPSLSLLGQTLREWATAIEFDYLAVCSDVTVTKDEQDAVVASTSELGIPVTTAPDRIARFLRRRDAEMKVVFATYQSSPQLASAQRGRVSAFDLVIADEAHRCAGPEAGPFATVVDAKKIKARKRLFMTATPRYFTGRVKKEAKEADWEIASMDDETKFGNVLHRLTFAQAIEQDLLSDYQVVVVGVSDEEAHDLAERGAFVTRDGETVTDARTLARQVGLLRAMRNYDLHRVVSFHSRIDGASRFASSLLHTNEWLSASRRPTGKLWADHVSGKMTAGERDVRLRRLRAVELGEHGVLTNARCLTEGVDVPTLDGVAFIDPRRSQVDVVQAVGRAIRRAEEKILGTIVVPVLVDEDADPEEVLERSEFDRVWQIVRALRDHDEDLAEELDELRRELGRRQTSVGRPRKIVLDLPVQVGENFSRAFDAKIVEATSAPWHCRYGLLLRFKEQNGHLRVHPRLRYAGVNLGNWSTAQRVLYRSRSLSTERRALLTEIGFEFTPRDDRFDSDCAEIDKFVREHGHLPRTSGKTKEERRLAYNIRLWRRQAQAETLADWKRARLNELPGFFWSAFEESLALITDFIRQHGRRPNERVTANRSERTLAARLRAIEARLLTPEQRALVKQTLSGLPEPKSRQSTRAELVEAICHFAEEHGRLPKNGTGDATEQRLATHINYIRTQKEHGKLSPDDERQYETIDGWFWKLDLDSRFDKHADAVEEFVRLHGRLPKRSSNDAGEAFLAQWCSSRRLDHRKARIPEQRVHRLQRIPGLIPSDTGPRPAVRLAEID